VKPKIWGVITRAGAPFIGVQVDLTDVTRTFTTWTGDLGYYEFSSREVGSYNITPSKEGYTFDPLRLPVTLTESGLENQNFVAVETVPTPAPTAITDLLISRLKAPRRGRIGKKVLVKFQVRDKGKSAGDLISPFSVGLYLSSDNYITALEDTLLKRVKVKRLEGAASFAVRVTLPRSLSAGDYYIGAVADVWNHISEQNEGNNTRAAARATSAK